MHGGGDAVKLLQEQKQQQQRWQHTPSPTAKESVRRPQGFRRRLLSLRNIRVIHGSRSFWRNGVLLLLLLLYISRLSRRHTQVYTYKTLHLYCTLVIRRRRCIVSYFLPPTSPSIRRVWRVCYGFRAVYFYFSVPLSRIIISSFVKLQSCERSIIIVFSRPDGKRFSRHAKPASPPSSPPPPSARPGSMTNLHTHTRARAALVRSLAGNGNITSILTYFIFRFFCRFSSIIYLSAHWPYYGSSHIIIIP